MNEQLMKKIKKENNKFLKIDEKIFGINEYVDPNANDHLSFFKSIVKCMAPEKIAMTSLVNNNAEGIKEIKKRESMEQDLMKQESLLRVKSSKKLKKEKTDKGKINGNDDLKNKESHVEKSTDESDSTKRNNSEKESKYKKDVATEENSFVDKKAPNLKEKLQGFSDYYNKNSYLEEIEELAAVNLEQISALIDILSAEGKESNFFESFSLSELSNIG